MKFDWSCLKQDKVRFIDKQVVNIFIVYKTNLCSSKQNDDFTLANSLLRAAKLTKNAGFDKYKYSRYGIGFDARGNF